jgi:2-polyprenyl-3-methyl-5-hydroxy-6-metoxy-1,4-benzoquinol methylase
VAPIPTHPTAHDQARGGLLSPFLQRRRIARAAAFASGRVLDYGCGNGALFSLLPEADRPGYLGYDPDESVLGVARARFPAAAFTSDRAQLEGRVFDTAISLAVIEHVPSVEEFLATLARLIDDRGEIVLTSPRQSVDRVHAVGARLGLFSREASDEHNEYVSRESVAAYAAAVGLELKRFEPFLLGTNQLFVLGQPGPAH